MNRWKFGAFPLETKNALRDGGLVEALFLETWVLARSGPLWLCVLE